MASVTIDGNSIEFEEGETVIQVAERSSIEIPYYCWHPRLSIAANCRMCLVEVEGAPKLLPACQTACRDGMVVNTANERVQEAQRAVHEFLLINHPIDCPICDQSGECKLQDYYMLYQNTPSRRRDPPVRKHKREQIGPRVVYDAERCIVCTRCVRFMDEVVGDSQLGIFNRGDHTVIGCSPGQELDSQYSLNTVDICPVGALTSSQFRFKQRVWNLNRSDGICPGCARGCNVHVDHRAGQVYRFVPRDNDFVNASWMCDDGRLTYEWANEGRINHALMRQNGDLVEARGSDALDEAEDLLAPVADARSGLGAAISLQATCEEAYVFGRVVKEVLGAQTVAIMAYGDWEGDNILRVSDRNPNRKGVMRVLQDLGIEPVSVQTLAEQVKSGDIKALLTVGHEGEGVEELAAVGEKLEVFVHIGHARSPLTHAAQVALPGLAWVQVDGTWINVDGHAQRLRPAFAPIGDSRAHHEWLLALSDALGVDFPLPSPTTVRQEMERHLPSFHDAKLNELGPQGRALDFAESEP